MTCITHLYVSNWCIAIMNRPVSQMKRDLTYTSGDRNWPFLGQKHSTLPRTKRTATTAKRILGCTLQEFPRKALRLFPKPLLRPIPRYLAYSQALPPIKRRPRMRAAYGGKNNHDERCSRISAAHSVTQQHLFEALEL